MNALCEVLIFLYIGVAMGVGATWPVWLYFLYN